MNKIPFSPLPELYEKADFRDEEFALITECEHFIVEMQYPLLGMKNAENRCVVRKEVLERLHLAASFLPHGYRFKILDAWRPFALQKELYDTYKSRIITEFKLEKASDKEQEAFISKFVSLPSENRNVPPVHTTGGAIDLTIIDSNGIELPMGTDFDAFTDETNTEYFESSDNTVIRDNRRLLYNVMIKAGFTNLPSEWWHYDYGDRFWAFYTDSSAIYKGVFSRSEIIEG